MDIEVGQWIAWAPFTLAWVLGWFLVARPRPLPTPSGPSDLNPISVVVPARDEECSLPRLLASLESARGIHEVIVVDDDSSDATAATARERGAVVVRAGPLPDGWAGKPHACWIGARRATGDVLVFLDADVVAGPGMFEGIVAALPPEGLVSVQPWHTPGRPVEQLSLFGNVVALAATGRFVPFRRHRTDRPVAFGPVLAVRRDRYIAVGGHAHPDVRCSAIEDVALARRIGTVELYTGRPQATFRMYPGGLRELFDGWTRVLARGMGAAPRWSTAATAIWIWALAAAPFVGWPAYAAAALQVGVVGRRAGRFSPIAAACYPLPLLVFVAASIRSVTVRLLARGVRWKGRTVGHTADH